MSLSFQTFLYLIRRDMAVFWPTFKDRFINGCIWAAVVAVVFQYVLTKMGMPTNYGTFIAASNVMSWGFFEVMENVSKLIADLEGEKSISYYLTLPIPQWAVFVRIGVSNALQAAAIGILILPLTSLILWGQIDLTNFSWIKFVVMFIIGHIFYGMFGLCMASWTKDMNAVMNSWMRIVFPMWFIGCYQFPWSTLLEANKIIAYIDLLNPIVHAMEGMRDAVLGAGPIPFWISCVMLLVASMISAGMGTKLLMRRLDCLTGVR